MRLSNKTTAVVAVKGGIIKDGAITDEREGKCKVSGTWFDRMELRGTPVEKTPSQYFKLLKSVTARIMDDVEELIEQYVEPDADGNRFVAFPVRPVVTFNGKEVRAESLHLNDGSERVRVRVEGGIEFTLTTAHDTSDALSIYWAVFKLLECNV